MKSKTFSYQIKSNSKRLSKGFEQEDVLWFTNLDLEEGEHEAGELLLEIMEGVFLKVLAAILSLSLISFTC